MLLLLVAGLATAAPIKSVLIPGTTVSFDLVELAYKGVRSFRIGRTEVTWDEYNLYADSFADEKIDGITRPSQPDVVNPRDPFPDGTVQTGRHPARSIGMYGAWGYCDWLSRKTGRRFRLPKESEWIGAAVRSSRSTTAWHAGNSGGHPHPVGTQPANRYGIADTLGNVAELCLEPYSDQGSDGVVRGGSFKTPVDRFNMALRERIDMDAWQEDDPKRPIRDWWFTDAPFVGFRVVEPEADDRTPAERAAALAQIMINDIRVADPGSGPRWLARITGELAYESGDPLDEVEVDACFADASGSPIRTDPRGKPSYGRTWPVLAGTQYPDGREFPLIEGRRRSFSAIVPVPFDEVGPVPVGKPIVKVTWVRFAR